VYGGEVALITSIEGKLAGSGSGWVDVNLGAVTLRASVPDSAIDSLGSPGDRVRLFTSLQTREDSLTLYGFPSAEERSAFEALILVNGVGPRVALSVLSTMSPDSLALAVAAADVDAFKGVSGVGTRTANRIVLELKGKLDTELRIAAGGPADDDLLQALTALDYSASEVAEAAASLPPGSDLSLEDRVRLCILHLGGS